MPATRAPAAASAAAVLLTICLNYSTAAASPGKVAHADVAGVYTVGGVKYVPSTDDLNNLDTPTAAELAAKDQQTLAVNTTITDDLAVGVLDNVPADSEVLDPNPDVLSPSGSQPPKADSLNVQGEKQLHEKWCVPASTSIVLDTIGSSHDPGQAQLAQDEGTDSNGTYMPRARRPLNNHEDRNDYIWTKDPGSSTALLDDSASDVYNRKSSLILAIDVKTIGYYPTGYTGNHAIVNYGYYTQHKGGLYVFDPEDGKDFGQPDSEYGKHVVTAGTAYSSIEIDASGIVY